MNKTYFKVYSSLGIPDKLQYILFGSRGEGPIEPGMFAGITLNSSLVMTVRIHEVTKIEVPEDKSIDTLLICHCEDKELYDFLLSMGVWSETISISVEGED